MTAAMKHAGAFTLVTVCGMLVLAGCATQPQTFTAHGAFTLISSDASGIGADGNGPCFGMNGYDDIGATTDVNVYDASGRLIAATTLGNGETTSSSSGADECLFIFTIKDVPVTSGLYQVEVGARGKLTETVKQMRAGIVLSLGE